MKAILVSTRVDAHPDRRERRDALDQQLCRFVVACGFLPVLVPNVPETVDALVTAVRPHAVLLSGGNDLAALGGATPERDATESLLVDAADRLRIPIVGICRGMQFLMHRAGAPLTRVEGHVAARHGIRGLVNRDVNSYHSWAVTACPTGWDRAAVADDGSIELAACAARKQWGLMWHPERESPMQVEDVALVAGLLAGRGLPVAGGVS